jgi:uncharacterized protein (TIGR02231 family)
MKKLFSIIMLLSSISVMAQQDTAKVNATLTNATVYFGYGAELTHKANVKISNNTKFIVIDKLSTQIDLNSLQISCPENVSLLSQQFIVNQAEEEEYVESMLTKRIKDTIKLTQREISSITNKVAIEEEVMKKTDKLIESTIATSGNKTTLTAEVLKLIEFNNFKIEKSKKAIFDFQQAIVDLQEKMNDLTVRLAIAQNVKKNPGQAVERPYGRLILQVVCRNSQDADLSMSYYTNNAGWQPIYDIRVNSKTNALKLVYKASVIQNTGIDWVKTKLVLSTGTPSFTTTAPLLNAWYLQYYVPQMYNTLSEVVVTGYNRVQSFNDNDFRKKEDKDDEEGATVAPSTLEQFTTLKQGLLNTSFEIDLPYDIASNGQAHSINIKEEQIQSVLKNYAVPKLDPDAFLLAEVTNWESLDLIPGNANIIMDETYIGKAFIDPNSTSDTLNLSLGKDKRVGIKRTLLKDASLNKEKNANVKQSFTYELVVKNNKLKDINIVLKDQYPLSNVQEIEVELLDDGGAAVNAELGVLTWKLTLKPGESKKLRFSYTVKYPKGKKIANLK